MSLHLELQVPGLLGPWPGPQVRYVCEDLAVPATRRLLSRATAVAGVDALAADADEDMADLLFQRFGHRRGAADGQPGHPAAAVSRLADGGEADAHTWVRLDPVHLRADPHGAHVLHGANLDLDLDEARALADELLPALQHHGLGEHIEVRSPHRWYVRWLQARALSTRSPAALSGAASGASLPAGEGGRIWRAWLTEAQMQLHASAVNAAREARGEVPVNSVWPWGAGRLPGAAALALDALHADDAVARGLACLHGMQALPAAAGLEDLLDGRGERQLVVLPDFHGLAHRGEVEQWRAALQAFERDWALPLLTALRAGRLSSVIVHAAPALPRRLTRAGLWRVWRVPVPLPVLLEMVR